MRKLFYAVLAALVFLTSCKSVTVSVPSDCEVVYPLDITREEADISRYISDLQLVKIGNDTLCPADIRKIIVQDGKYYALSGGCVFEIASDGSDISRVGNVGRGPGEYLSIKDIAVDAGCEEILCLDVLNNVHRYGLPDKEYRRTTVIEQTDGCAEAIVPLTDGLMAVFFPNPPSTEEYEDKTLFNCLRTYDEKGKPQESLMPWADYNIEASFSIPASFSGSNRCVLAPESYTPCLFFEDGVQTRKVLFDFGKKNVPFGYAFSMGDEPMNMIGAIFDGPYYKLLSNVFTLPDYTYFRVYGKDCTLWNFILPEGQEGIRWESIGVASPPVAPVGVDGDYLLIPYNDYGLTSDEKDPVKKSVIEKFGLPEGNKVEAYLIKVKFDVNKE